MPDGSTKEIIVQLSDFHGFAVVDFAARKEIRRVTLPDPPGQKTETQGIQGAPVARTGDHAGRENAVGHQQILWLCGRLLAAGLQAVEGGAGRQLHPEWLTIPPDGKNLYVAVAGEDEVAWWTTGR